MKKDCVRLSIDVSRQMHQRLKIHSAREGLTIMDIGRLALVKYFKEEVDERAVEPITFGEE